MAIIVKIEVWSDDKLVVKHASVVHPKITFYSLDLSRDQIINGNIALHGVKFEANSKFTDE